MKTFFLFILCAQSTSAMQIRLEDSAEAKALASINQGKINGWNYILKLVEAAGGNNVNAQDQEGNTPLMLAAKIEYYEGVLKILELKADPLMVNKRGENALAIALASTDCRLVKVLNQATARALKIKEGMQMSRGSIDPLTEEVRRKILDLMVSKKNIDALDAQGNTSLMLAAQIGDYGLVIQLLRLGANPHTKNAQGDTALALACRGTNTDLINALIDAGEKVKSSNN